MQAEVSSRIREEGGGRKPLTEKDLGLLPLGSGIASSNLFRGELAHAIEPAALAQRPLAQDNVFAAARHYGHVLRLSILPEHGAVAEVPVNGGVQDWRERGPEAWLLVDRTGSGCLGEGRARWGAYNTVGFMTP